MRNAFAASVTELAEQDPSLVLMTGDLGYSVFDDFRTRRPDQFINAGLSEQAMVGMAAGLAMAGKRVYVYSIIPFVVFRALEQIRDDLCYQNLPVTIVGVGSGWAYGAEGGTHHATDDLGVMTSIPGLTVVAPGDPAEVRALMPQIHRHPGPVYLRLNRGGDPIVHDAESAARVTLGRPAVVLESDPAAVAIVTTGCMLPVGAAVARRLIDASVRCRLISLHTMKPCDEATLQDCLRHAGKVVTIEEHVGRNGLASLVSAVVAPADRLSFHAGEGFCHDVGGQEYLRQRRQLTDEAIAARVMQSLRPSSSPSATDGTGCAGGRLRISIVTPCFNEEANLRLCHETVKRLFDERLPEYEREHIFADNSSLDGSEAVLRDLAAADPSTCVVLNSRNYGPFRSTFNALRHATGDAVVVMLAADLQDPPELIPAFVERWRRGADIVSGRRATREENVLLRAARRVFYGLVHRLSQFEIPEHVGEFQLIDRRVHGALMKFDDHYPFLRGMIASCGFRREIVDYTWKRRSRGLSKNSMLHLVDQALNGIISFSTAPLRICLAAGFAVAFLSIVYAVVQTCLNLIAYVRSGSTLVAPGVTTLIVAQFFFAGVILFVLGVIGEYISAIHGQVRRRPMVVEREVLNEPRATAS